MFRTGSRNAVRLPSDLVQYAKFNLDRIFESELKIQLPMLN